MIAPISSLFRPIEPIAPISGGIAPAVKGQSVSAPGGFKELLTQALNAVNDAGNVSDADALSIMTGQVSSPHDILISTEEAKIALDLTLAIRSKAIDAYNEIMRMQI